MKNFIKKSVAVALMCAITVANTGICMLTADASASEYKSWKQGDSRWGSVHLGSSGQTLSRIGCAVTSMAILMVHSGSVTDEDFDPGVLCNYLSSNGGFDRYGNIRWGAATGMAGSFTYQGGGTISGSKSAKAAEIKSYLDSGYYVAVSVKYGGHWVAIDYVSDDGTVYMIDPAKGQNVDLFSVYSEGGVGQVRLFKGANSKSIDGSEATPVISANTTVNNTAEPEETAETSYEEGRYTSTDVLNIRAGASLNSDILGKLPNGTSVFVYDVDDFWGKVSYNGLEGWVSLKYAEYGGVVPSYTEGLYSTVADLNLRTKADINSAVQLIIPVKKTLPVTEISNGWGKVEYNGVSGWICMDYTSYDGAIPEETAAEEEIVAAVPVIAEPEKTETVNPANTTVNVFTNIPKNTQTQTTENVSETVNNIFTNVVSAVTSSTNVAAPAAPAVSSSSKTGYYLTFDQVNMRKSADASSDLITRVPGYAKVNVTEIKNNWGKVTFQGNEGWICLDYAKPCDIKLSGDINGDGYITINDYNLLRQEIINNRSFTKAEITVADLNGDGIVDMTDADLLEAKIG